MRSAIIVIAFSILATFWACVGYSAIAQDAQPQSLQRCGSDLARILISSYALGDELEKVKAERDALKTQIANATKKNDHQPDK